MLGIDSWWKIKMTSLVFQKRGVSWEKRKITNILRNKEQIQQSVIAFSTAVSLSQKSPQKNRKKTNKIDKNGTFILQHCPVNHIIAKGHTFFCPRGK